MTSYDASPSIEVFRLGEYDSSMSNLGPLPAIHEVPSFDLEAVRSHPRFTRDESRSSFSTQWSNDTTQISNTTKRESKEEKYKKRKFVLFVKILMGILREKDEGRFRNAKAVICNCEQQKRRGEIESISESLRYPLKDAVGPQFWSEARQQFSETMSNRKTRRSSVDASKESDIQAPCPPPSVQNDEDEYSPYPLTFESKTCTKNIVAVSKTKELRRRNKRLWMVIRVFMKYLRSEHRQLYRRAHALVNECMQQHRRVGHREESGNLSGSIENCLKKEFGLDHWNRAEHFVTESLRERRENRR